MNLIAAVFCVVLFSLTAPFTRIAALSVNPELIILLRIAGAGVVCLLFVLRDKWIPPKKAILGIIGTALGSVIGFNAFMAYGLREVSAGHAAVALACLPISTSIYSIFRDRLNPGPSFWVYALVGSALSLGFFFVINVEEVLPGDIYLLLSVLAAAFGYVEGGRSSRHYGGARTMSWAVLITLPVCLPLLYFQIKNSTLNFSELKFHVWFSLLYLALVSQSLGMFLWFKVLAKGPMEKISLVQQLQPFLTLVGAILLLDEKVLPITWIVAALVAVCVVWANKERQKVTIVKG